MSSHLFLPARPSTGERLPHAVGKVMESFFDADLSDVRIHVGPQPAAIGAQAFAHGSDIYFAPGRYDLESAAGRRVLGHELTHVIQQRSGRAPAPARAGTWLLCDPALEAEADRLGTLAAERIEAELGPGPYPLGEGATPARRTELQTASVIQPLVITVANQNGGNAMNNQALKTFIDSKTQGATANAGKCANTVENHDGYTSGGGTNIALTGNNATVFHASHGKMGKRDSVTVFFIRTGGNAASAQNPGTIVAVGYHSAKAKNNYTYTIEWYDANLWPLAYRNSVTL